MRLNPLVMLRVDCEPLSDRVLIDALQASNINKSIITHGMGLLRDLLDGPQLFCGLEKTFVAARNVIIRLNSEDMRIGGLFDDGIDAVQAQTVSADPHEVCPVSRVNRRTVGLRRRAI